MAKAEAKVETPKKKPLYVEPIMEITAHNDHQKLVVPGWMFTTQNLTHNNKKGWRHWRPVTRSSELGQEVLSQFGIVGDSLQGLNDETDYIMYGPETVLAYTSVELFDKHAKAEEDAANRQLRAVGDDIDITRHVQIDPGPFKGGDK